MSGLVRCYSTSSTSFRFSAVANIKERFGSKPVLAAGTPQILEYKQALGFEVKGGI